MTPTPFSYRGPLFAVGCGSTSRIDVVNMGFKPAGCKHAMNARPPAGRHESRNRLLRLKDISTIDRKGCLTLWKLAGLNVGRCAAGFGDNRNPHQHNLLAGTAR